MRFLDTVRLRARSLLLGARVERELDEEMRYHLERQIEENLSRGMMAPEAEIAARREFGGLDQRKEECRDARGLNVLESLVQDARYALRSLRQRKAFATVAILSLALGIGANTALFSILNALALRSLPVEDPASLAVFSSGSGEAFFTNAVWERIRDRRGFERSLAWSWDRFDLAPGGPTDFVSGIWASGGAFDALGTRPEIGRLLSPGDDRPGGGAEGQVIVVSYPFWQKRLGGGADAIGRSLTIERVPFRIVGVAPRGFAGLDVGLPFDIAVPLAAMPLLRPGTQLQSPYGPWVSVMVRAKPGESLDQASAKFQVVQPEIRKEILELPDYVSFQDRDAVLAEPLFLVPAARGLSFLRQRYERPLVALLLIVGLVLLIACFNIANLQLARTSARRHELSVRRALGATRARLARQLFVESALLSALGALLGLGLASAVGPLLVRQLSTPAYRVSLDLSPDVRVLAVTAAIAVATALLFGIAPALHGARSDPMGAQKGPAFQVVVRRGVGLAPAMMIGQIAISLVILVAAGLFLRTFTILARLDIGFERDPVLVAGIDARRSGVPAQQRAALAERLREAISGIPGVSGATLAMVLPGGNLKATRRIELPDAAAIAEENRTVATNLISPDWFHTLGASLVAGRDFDARDRPGAPLAAIVNVAFARRFWGEESPLGRPFFLSDDGSGHRRSFEVVGVARDAVYYSIREAAPPTLYLAVAQASEPLFPQFNLCVRTATGSPFLLARAVAEAVGREDPNLSVTFRSLRDQVNAQYAQERLVATLSSFFGALALLLAAIGLFGITADSVARRRAEIAIHTALGATPRRVVGVVLATVGWQVGMGIGLGIVGSLWAARFVAPLLYGLRPRDPATLVASSVMLSTVALIAGWIPARRAARIDPASLLRDV